MKLRSRVLQANAGCHPTHQFTLATLKTTQPPSFPSSSRNNTEFASLLGVRPHCHLSVILCSCSDERARELENDVKFGNASARCHEQMELQGKPGNLALVRIGNFAWFSSKPYL